MKRTFGTKFYKDVGASDRAAIFNSSLRDFIGELLPLSRCEENISEDLVPIVWLRMVVEYVRISQKTLDPEYYKYVVEQDRDGHLAERLAYFLVTPPRSACTQNRLTAAIDPRFVEERVDCLRCYSHGTLQAGDSTDLESSMRDRTTVQLAFWKFISRGRLERIGENLPAALADLCWSRADLESYYASNLDRQWFNAAFAGFLTAYGRRRFDELNRLYGSSPISPLMHLSRYLKGADLIKMDQDLVESPFDDLAQRPEITRFASLRLVTDGRYSQIIEFSPR